MSEKKNVKRNIFSETKNENRFFKIQGNTESWYYDSFTHGLYKIGDNLEAAEKVLKTVKEDIQTVPEKSPSAYVMLNTSNRCNLDCAYCYRNKTNPEVNTFETAKKSLDYVTKTYKPDSKSYVISYSMTSESSVDLPLLKLIADEYINYENYQFQSSHINKNTFDFFYSQLKDDFKNLNDIPFPQNNRHEVAGYLNKLLNKRNLIDLLGMTEDMFDSGCQKEIRKREILAKWRVFRLNRWALDIKYEKFLKKRKSPLVTFWFMTNGTCASKEYIDFVKSCDINPLWISLDGPKEVHDYNRKYNNGNGSYDEVIQNIKIFKENRINIKASAVITAYFPKPLKIIKHFSSIGVDQISMTPVRPGTECSFTEENIQLLINGYDEIYTELKKNALNNDFSLFKLLKEDVTLAAFYSFINRTKIYKRCDFDNQIVINSKGEIYPCFYFTGNRDFKYGDIENGIDEEKMRQSIIVTERESCKECWARYLCGGTCHYGSYKNQGDYMGTDLIECKLKKHLAEKCLELIVFMKENEVSLENII